MILVAISSIFFIDAILDKTTTEEVSASTGEFFGLDSPFTKKIDQNSTFIEENSIGSLLIQDNYNSARIYRIAANEIYPQTVRVISIENNKEVLIPFPDRILEENFPNIAIIDNRKKMIYEIWSLNYSQENFTAWRINAYPLKENGVSVKNDIDVSGFGIIAGMITKQDLVDPITGKIYFDKKINHALTMSLPSHLISSEFVKPAIRGLDKGLDSKGEVPIGALFTISQTLDIDNLDIHPLSKSVLKAIQDYGVYITDENFTSEYKEKARGAIRFESGVLEVISLEEGKDLKTIFLEDTYKVFNQYGMYRVID